MTTRSNRSLDTATYGSGFVDLLAQPLRFLIVTRKDERWCADRHDELERAGNLLFRVDNRANRRLERCGDLSIRQHRPSSHRRRDSRALHDDIHQGVRVVHPNVDHGNIHFGDFNVGAELKETDRASRVVCGLQQFDRSGNHDENATNQAGENEFPCAHAVERTLETLFHITTQ